MADFLHDACINQFGDACRGGGDSGVTPYVLHVVGGKLLRQLLVVVVRLVIDDTCLCVAMLIVKVVLPHQSEQGFVY